MASSKSPRTFHCTNCDWKKFIPSDKDKLFIDQKSYTHCPRCNATKLSVITGNSLADMLLSLVQKDDSSNNDSYYHSLNLRKLNCT